MESRQVKLQLLEVELLNMKKAVKYCDEIKKLIPKFEGKVINKRFDTALKEIDHNLSFSQQFNSFQIELYKEPRSIDGGNGWNYVKNHSLSIIHASLQSSMQDGICQNGTLNGTNLIKYLDQNKEYWQLTIKAISAQIKTIDKIIARRDKIQAEKEIFRNEINFYIRDYFDLKIS